jgi:hypothetical protein
MTKIPLTRLCDLASQYGAREAQARIAELEAIILEALRAPDEDRTDILRKGVPEEGKP